MMRKANNSRHKRRRVAGEKAYCCAASLVAGLVVALIFSRCWSAVLGVLTAATGTDDDGPCDEFYVVGEGETLQSIMDKCEDPFIVENNPQIHESDELFPGLVIRVMPFNDG